jgi:hypothetical protein
LNTLSSISNFIIGGFVLSTVVLPAGYWIFPRHRESLKQLLAISNVYLLLASLICLMINIKEISDSGSGSGGNVLGTASEASALLLYIPIIFKGLLPQILWFKRLRKSIWTSMLLLPFLLVDFFLPLFRSQENAFLPSSWNLYIDLKGLFMVIVIYGCLLAVTFLTARSKKLQNPGRLSK